MQRIDFGEIKKVYFVGIGGIGLSAIARMFLERGVQVGGSDLKESLVTEELRRLGAKINLVQTSDNIASDTDLVIYTIAVPEDNPELVTARSYGIETITYPEALGLISRSHNTIAVAGTHGKTTTTAMIAEILVETELSPTVIVGSLLKKQRSNFILGESNLFLVEACEYRESFLHLSPDLLVITNIEADHLDYYKDLKHIIDTFRILANKVPEEGTIVADMNNKNTLEALSGVKAKVVDYRDLVAGIKVGVPGEHNRENAAASLALATELGIEEEVARKALNEFSGTWRRFEEKGKMKNGALVYDDYAHHPSEIRATLKGAREKFPTQEIVAVFQPHLFSRTKELFDDFVESLKLADKVIVLPIYAAREKFDDSISHSMLAGKINILGGVSAVNDFSEAKELLSNLTTENSVILTLGAGDVTDLSSELVNT